MTHDHEQERKLHREVAAHDPGQAARASRCSPSSSSGPSGFCVYIDHPSGVDHALCVRVTDALRELPRPLLDRRLLARDRAAAADARAFRGRGRPTGLAAHRAADRRPRSVPRRGRRGRTRRGERRGRRRASLDDPVRRDRAGQPDRRRVVADEPERFSRRSGRSSARRGSRTTPSSGRSRTRCSPRTRRRRAPPGTRPSSSTRAATSACASVELPPTSRSG